MIRFSISCLAVLLATPLLAQTPPPVPAPPAVQLPTQQETLAKWPWSITLQGAPYKQQSVQFTLSPKEGMEFKYRLDANAGMLYTWNASADLHWELHSEPDGSPRGYAEFFDTNQGRGSHGIFKAPFPGIHGWWWENKSDATVTITLSTAGFYSESREFRKGQPVKITPIN